MLHRLAAELGCVAPIVGMRLVVAPGWAMLVKPYRFDDLTLAADLRCDDGGSAARQRGHSSGVISGAAELAGAAGLSVRLGACGLAPASPAAEEVKDSGAAEQRSSDAARRRV